MIGLLERCVPRHVACSRHHTELVTTYREERQRQEMIADELYPSEAAEHLRTSPLITFKAWLIAAARPREDTPT